MKLPTEPIKSATIFFTGDPSVGIPHASFNVELYVPLDIFDDPEEFRDYLNDLRKKLVGAYDFMQGDEPPYLMYDYEIANVNDAIDNLAKNLED